MLSITVHTPIKFIIFIPTPLNFWMKLCKLSELCGTCVYLHNPSWPSPQVHSYSSLSILHTETILRTCLSIPIVLGDKISPWLYIVAPTISLPLRRGFTALFLSCHGIFILNLKERTIYKIHTHIHKKKQ